MPGLLLYAAGALGLILGSFLNALLYRYKTGRSIAHGRSKCMHCGHTLGALDLIPVLSYMLLAGKCRYCRSRISWQYPLVELIAAVLSVALYIQDPHPLRFALHLVLFLTLLFVVVYDIRHKIIPWGALGLLAVLTLCNVYLQGPTGYALLAGPALAAPLLLLSLVSKGRWMGWGDGLLEMSLGWLLGLTAGLTALIGAFWAGAIVGIIAIGLSKRYTMSSEVPFAPFLILGAASAYFLHVDFFQALPALFF